MESPESLEKNVLEYSATTRSVYSRCVVHSGSLYFCEYCLQDVFGLRVSVGVDDVRTSGFVRVGI